MIVIDVVEREEFEQAMEKLGLTKSCNNCYQPFSFGRCQNHMEKWTWEKVQVDDDV